MKRIEIHLSAPDRVGSEISKPNYRTDPELECPVEIRTMEIRIAVLEPLGNYWELFKNDGPTLEVLPSGETRKEECGNCIHNGRQYLTEYFPSQALFDVRLQRPIYRVDGIGALQPLYAFGENPNSGL